MDARTFALERPVFRFALVSLISAVIDNGIFFLLFRSTGLIAGSQLGARVVSVLFNYVAVRNAVFRCDKEHGFLVPRYLFLVTLNAVLSYGGIRLITGTTRIPVVVAKMMAESVLFLINYAAQKAFVFEHQKSRRGEERPAG